MQKLHFSTETVKQTWMEESFINYVDIVCPLLKLSFLEIWLGIIAIIVTNLSLASKWQSTKIPTCSLTSILELTF